MMKKGREAALTEDLSSIDACSSEDLAAAWVLTDEGGNVVHAPIDHSPTIEL